MEIYMELNRRHGRGFQLRVVYGPMNKVYDKEPWTMYEAGAAAGTLLEILNKELGASYQTHQVLRVTQEALEVNSKAGDFAAVRMMHDINSGEYELSTPDTTDCTKVVIDGKEEIAFTGRGTVLITYFTWLDDKNQKAREALQRYCEYIAAHGFKGGATKALAELDSLNKDHAVEWIRKTYARHVHDDEALIQFVMGQL
ncbi:hypothetical protein D1159_03155 [Pseudoflavonifractor sp. 524-17]|uniref:hypothetical protein n=1 Tax=Pseudoflavonifractor sp. 524-17 TaxID=2304577 RepID=UPI00137AD268|nr:hypothetical protein [Pseudoflavonifractor sp. 524-17]NCE63599.1 hypothetical protein [Pseudoflavonifractor sp. 524-17]